MSKKLPFRSNVEPPTPKPPVPPDTYVVSGPPLYCLGFTKNTIQEHLADAKVIKVTIERVE